MIFLTHMMSTGTVNSSRWPVQGFIQLLPSDLALVLQYGSGLFL